jgi:hypothetical protein
MERVKVVGVKWFKGNIDGKDFDNGTAYIEEKLDDRRGTAKGYASTAYKLGSSAVALGERLSDGKGSSEPVIVDIRPAQDEAPAAAVTTLKKAS